MAKNDFDAYIEDLLVNGPEALLPRNLNESWFNCLLEKANLIREDKQSVEDLKYICSAVFLILEASMSSSKISLSDTELDALVLQYCTELELEALDRYTELTISPATLDNIFSNREVQVKKPLSH